MQLFRSLRAIARDPNTSTLGGTVRHGALACRRAVGAFPYEIPFSESVLVMQRSDCGCSILAYVRGLYDYNNMSFIRAFPTPDDVFLDVGANVGVYTILAAESGARVFAFEPHPTTASYLRTNVERNGLDGVTVVQAAVGDEAGQVAFTDMPGSQINRRLVNAEEMATVSVPAVRLDKVLEGNGAIPTLAKIDVEGFELPVLEGLGERLADIQVLLIEMKGHADRRGEGEEAMLGKLAGAGLEGPYWIDYDGRRFRRAKMNREDRVFVSGAGRERLARSGFVVEP